MNSIANIPGTGRGSTRVSGPEGNDGSDLEFQLALGLAAATQARAPHDLRSAEQRPVADEERDTPGADDRIAELADSQSDTLLDRTGDLAGDDGGHDAPSTQANVETRATESTGAPKAKPQAALPVSPAALVPPPAITPFSESPASGLRPGGEGTTGVVQIALPASSGNHAPRQSAGHHTMGEAMSVEHAAAAAGLHSRVIARRMIAMPAAALPVAVRPAQDETRMATAATAATAAAAVTATSASAAAPAAQGAPPAVLDVRVPQSTPLATPASMIAGVVEDLERAAVPVASAAGEPPRASAASPLAQLAGDHIANRAAMEEAPQPVMSTAPAALAQAVTRASAASLVLRSEPATTGALARTDPPTPRLDAPAPRPELSRPIAPAVPVAANGPRQQAKDGAPRQDRDSSRPGSEALPNAAAGAAPATEAPAASAFAANARASTTVESPAPATPAAGPMAPAALRDPRLEPMRRAADQVTLQFRGEDGLEGRLRISVRGDSVRASILSSHDGTLQRAGSELASLKRSLAEQGFTDAKLSVTDTRTVGSPAAGGAKDQPQSGEERRQGEAHKKQSQGRETRQDGGSPNRGRRESRDERRNA